MDTWFWLQALGIWILLLCIYAMLETAWINRKERINRRKRIIKYF
jgi:hypothetical protein